MSKNPQPSAGSPPGSILGGASQPGACTTRTETSTLRTLGRSVGRPDTPSIAAKCVQGPLGQKLGPRESPCGWAEQYNDGRRTRLPFLLFAACLSVFIPILSTIATLRIMPSQSTSLEPFRTSQQCSEASPKCLCMYNASTPSEGGGAKYARRCGERRKGKAENFQLSKPGKARCIFAMYCTGILRLTVATTPRFSTAGSWS